MSTRFYAFIDYEDPLIQPLILAALKSSLPPESYNLRSPSASDHVENLEDVKPLLQFRSYETLDFPLALSRPSDLINAYVIRKALIRKHYLSQTIFTWVTKNPASPLRRHFKPAVDFELDYAEFLDDALLEAYELKEAFERNEGKPPNEREWWILKPGMSDRGQGIRLFSTEEELRTIFEGWEEDENTSEDDSDEVRKETEDSEANEADDESLNGAAIESSQNASETANTVTNDEMITTSHLRHFIVQPYIHTPLLVSTAPFNNRKFHIRTYVVAAGALKVYVYKRMLALFASEPYSPPWDTNFPPVNQEGASSPVSDEVSANPQMDSKILTKLRNVHLTNTCVQTSFRAKEATSSSLPNPVHLLSSLPFSNDTHSSIQHQIHAVTEELFRAALAHPTNFQPLPQSFEMFGVDFLVEVGERNDNGEGSEEVNVQLLEVNAFPDFAQTQEELMDLVVKGLFEEVFRVIVGPHFDIENLEIKGRSVDEERLLVQVLDIDMGRHTR